MIFREENEVPGLELCKRLKELGYPQEAGGWYWVEMVKDNSDDCERGALIYQSWNEVQENKKQGLGWKEALKKAGVKIEIVDDMIEIFKAPTISEMWEWLPHRIVEGTEVYFLNISYFSISYFNPKYDDALGLIYDDLVPRIAKMLIWLAENGYVRFEGRINEF